MGVLANFNGQIKLNFLIQYVNINTTIFKTKLTTSI